MINYLVFINLYNLSHQSKIFDMLVVFCAEYLPYLAVIFIVIYIFKRQIGEFDWQKPFHILNTRIRDARRIFIGPIIAWIVVYIMKEIFKSPRPFIMFKEKVLPLFIHGGMDSFPSGHAAFFGALAVSVFFINKKIGFLYIIIAILIGIARIVSGVHFPIDILVGYVIGLISSLVLKYFFEKNQPKYNL